MNAELRYLWASWGANLRSALEYRGAFVLQATFMALNNLMFLAFWAVLFARFPSVRGWQLRDVALLYAVAATGFGLAVVLMGGCLELARPIAAGALDTWLLRPRGVFVQAGSSKLVTSGFGDLASGLLLVALSGNAMPARVLVFVPMALVAATVLVAFATLVNSLAFYLGRSEELAQTGVFGLVTFSLYPPGLFGGTARVLLYVVVPAGLLSYTPTALVRQWSWSQAALLALGVAALVAVTALVWRAGLRRYESGSLIQVLD